MSFCVFNPFPNRQYSNHLIFAAFSNFTFSVKTSTFVKILRVPTIPENKAEILAIYLSKLFKALFCSFLLSIILFFLNSHFKIRSSSILMSYFMIVKLDLLIEMRKFL